MWIDGQGKKVTVWAVIGGGFLGVLQGVAVMGPVLWLAYSYKHEIKAWLTWLGFTVR